IIYAIVVLAGALGLFMILSSGNPGTAVLPTRSQVESGSLLTAEERMHDFGTISMRDGLVTKNYVIKNNTDKDIKIDSVVTSCMCTNAFILRSGEKLGPFGMPGHGASVPKANEIIKAGEEWTIEAVFDPAAHGPLGVGRADRSIYIVDETGAALELRFIADVNL
ncbi:MAG: DUF1573 domain-containing protein, partial [bacterium]|nr:DUF1573 domain-containing protein [bacterium]